MKDAITEVLIKRFEEKLKKYQSPEWASERADVELTLEVLKRRRERD